METLVWHINQTAQFLEKYLPTQFRLSSVRKWGTQSSNDIFVHILESTYCIWLEIEISQPLCHMLSCQGDLSRLTVTFSSHVISVVAAFTVSSGPPWKFMFTSYIVLSAGCALPLITRPTEERHGVTWPHVYLLDWTHSLANNKASWLVSEFNWILGILSQHQ